MQTNKANIHYREGKMIDDRCMFIYCLLVLPARNKHSGASTPSSPSKRGFLIGMVIAPRLASKPPVSNRENHKRYAHDSKQVAAKTNVGREGKATQPERAPQPTTPVVKHSAYLRDAAAKSVAPVATDDPAKAVVAN